MKITVDQERNIILQEIYNGVILETREGNQISICMRDDTFEINILSKKDGSCRWHRINMQERTIEKTNIKSNNIESQDNCGSEPS